MLGVETGIRYELVGPDGTSAVFNDPEDAAYAGRLVNITGLDSPEVREAAWDRPQAPGGAHGTFFHGRRPIVMDLEVLASSPTERNEMLDRIRRASRALAEDAELIWTPTGGEEVSVPLRRQQPNRVSGAWMKTAQIALVCADPWIASTAEYDEVATYVQGSPDAGTINLDYDGDAPGPLVITITGPTSSVEVTNEETGLSIFLAAAVPASESVAIHMHRARAWHSSGAEWTNFVDFANSAWWSLIEGANEISFNSTGTTTGPSTVEVAWHNAWE